MDGEWRRVGYIPGAILINTADMLEVQTSGEYKAAVSIRHFLTDNTFRINI